MPCRQDAPVWGAASSTCARTYAPAEGTPPSCHRNTRPAGIGKWEMAKLGNCCTAVRFPFGVRGEEKKNTHIFQTARCRWPREREKDTERERETETERFFFFLSFSLVQFFSAPACAFPAGETESAAATRLDSALSLSRIFIFPFCFFSFFSAFCFLCPVCASLPPSNRNGKMGNFSCGCCCGGNGGCSIYTHTSPHTGTCTQRYLRPLHP